MINTKERTLHSITVCSCLRTHLTLFISGVCRSAHPSFVNRCFLKNEPIILCLTYFYFHRTVLSKKYLEEFDGKSIFYACHQNGSKTEKIFCYSKVTSAVLISHFRGLLIVIFRRIKCNGEYQVINCWFLSWLCTEIQYWNLHVYQTPQKLRFFILFDR